MSIEKRIERIEAILDARGLDWDHPRVEEKPAKEALPEHPAGPKPNPGEGYRLLSKDPPEKLSPGDDFWSTSYGEWHKSTCAASGIAFQSDVLWFRRKIEAPKPAEPEYREPVLPGDAGKVCQFSDDGQSWLSGWVYGWVPGRNWVTLNNNNWKHARIKKES